MIGARSRCITGPAARANNAANSGPRRCAIGSCMIPPSTAPAASRRAAVVRPAADHSNPIAPTASPPSAATAHRTSCPRSRSARATGDRAWTCPAPPVLVHSTRSGLASRQPAPPTRWSRSQADVTDRNAERGRRAHRSTRGSESRGLRTFHDRSVRPGRPGSLPEVLGAANNSWVSQPSCVPERTGSDIGPPCRSVFDETQDGLDRVVERW